MKPLVSVLVAEPSDIITEGLRSILAQSGRYNILAPMHDISSLEERLPAIHPDLLIVNPTLLSATPKQQLANIARLRPSMPIVALVYQYVEQSLLDNFRYVLDIRLSGSAIFSLINTAVESSKGETDTTDTPDNYELSSRETDVLVLVAKGLSSKEIADRLNISVHTVNSHRKNITHKTGIRSVAGLAVYAMIHNLMEGN